MPAGASGPHRGGYWPPSARSAVPKSKIRWLPRLRILTGERVGAVDRGRSSSSPSSGMNGDVRTEPPPRYLTPESRPTPSSSCGGSGIPRSRAAVLWLMTAPGTTLFWSTQAIASTLAGAQVGV
ncbi:hypothetical protein JOD52_002204 [Brachybacterium muris]|uniref:hypothetical protein n=1 Tax=Brachybacterium muris TaxID=219301 RepID=UPI00195A6BD4|nr:hypothetical protein [Brachybacterium muris]MBM7501364.1 hypothetical protein [Brachybacterium muris]